MAGHLAQPELQDMSRRKRFESNPDDALVFIPDYPAPKPRRRRQKRVVQRREPRATFMESKSMEYRRISVEQAQRMSGAFQVDGHPQGLDYLESVQGEHEGDRSESAGALIVRPPSPSRVPSQDLLEEECTISKGLGTTGLGKRGNDDLQQTLMQSVERWYKTKEQQSFMDKLLIDAKQGQTSSQRETQNNGKDPILRGRIRPGSAPLMRGPWR